MIDLSRGIEKPYEIRLEDKTILKLKKPTQGLLLELARLQELTETEQPIEVIEQINNITTRVFNRNMNGRTFTEAEVAEMLDFETAMYDDRYYTETEMDTKLNGKEPAFSKNNAFNKNFGSSAGTVCQGNDSRLSNARRASNITMSYDGNLRISYS